MGIVITSLSTYGDKRIGIFCGPIFNPREAYFRQVALTPHYNLIEKQTKIAQPISHGNTPISLYSKMIGHNT